MHLALIWVGVVRTWVLSRSVSTVRDVVGPEWRQRWAKGVQEWHGRAFSLALALVQSRRRSRGGTCNARKIKMGHQTKRSTIVLVIPRAIKAVISRPSARAFDLLRPSAESGRAYALLYSVIPPLPAPWRSSSHGTRWNSPLGSVAGGKRKGKGKDWTKEEALSYRAGLRPKKVP